MPKNEADSTTFDKITFYWIEVLKWLHFHD